MKKVYVQLVIKAIVNVDENVSVLDVVNEMDYNFTSCTNGADIIDTEITNFYVTDSK